MSTVAAVIISDLFTRARDLSGLSTDEVSDTVLNQFVLDSWEKVKNMTGRQTWVLGETGYESAEEAAVFFAVQRAYLRAGMKDRAAAAEQEGLRMAQSVQTRVALTVKTG